MFEWHRLSKEQRLSILNDASAQTGYPINIIEKDWWVTVALKAVFDTPWKDSLVFKGGTSLSKAWNLIERFSEDIDLAIDRTALGFKSGELTKSQIAKLRKVSAKFMEETFMPALQQCLLENGIDPDQFSIEIDPIPRDDVDPRIIKLKYVSLVPGNEYVRDQVLIEIGARSLREPCTARPIRSILTELFPGTLVADEIFVIETVLPERTFLEKAMLLHEEFSKALEDRRHLRLSRHLYDLHRISLTDHATTAIADKGLFNTIMEHRRAFTAIRGISYENHTYLKINFMPPEDIVEKWREDYSQMTQMIYGDRPDFDTLMVSIDALLQRFREAEQPVL